MLLDKLAFTENKYEELSVKISDPSIMANQKEWRKLCKEHADLEVIVTAYREYKKVVEDLEANKEMLEEETDKEMREMLSEEISSLKAQEEELENKIQILLLPKDPNDDKNVFVEIRAGAGGDEAALFAANLFRMYTRYAESQRWSVELMSSNENDLGGFKEVVFMIKGNSDRGRKCETIAISAGDTISITESKELKKGKAGVLAFSARLKLAVSTRL